MSQSSFTSRQARMRGADLVSLDTVRVRLATIWLGGASVILLIVVLQSLLNRYGDKTQEAWAWLLPTLMPSLGMIISVLGYTALDPVLSGSVVRKSFLRVAQWLSVLYLGMILLTILIQPLAGREPVELMRTSNL